MVRLRILCAHNPANPSCALCRDTPFLPTLSARGRLAATVPFSTRASARARESREESSSVLEQLTQSGGQPGLMYARAGARAVRSGTHGWPALERARKLTEPCRKPTSSLPRTGHRAAWLSFPHSSQLPCPLSIQDDGHDHTSCLDVDVDGVPRKGFRVPFVAPRTQRELHRHSSSSQRLVVLQRLDGRCPSPHPRLCDPRHPRRVRASAVGLVRREHPAGPLDHVPPDPRRRAQGLRVRLLLLFALSLESPP